LFNTIVAKIFKNNISFDIRNDSEAKIFDVGNYLPLQEINIGVNTRKVFNNSEFKELDRVTFYKGVRDHNVAVAKHILKKSSINDSSFLKYCRILQPHQIKISSERHVQAIAEKLPLMDINNTLLTNGWSLLKCEKCVINYQTCGEGNCIEKFWKDVFQIKHADDITLKYANITKVVKAVLSLSHGSADVERGFSTSKRILTDDKTGLLCRTLNARLNIIDGLAMYENRPEFVPISKKLIQMATLAHKSYQGYLENEGAKKRICEEEHLRDQLKSIQTSVEVVVTESKSLEALESELKTRESNVLQQNKAACSILQQASERLDSAIEKGDLVEVRVAKGLLEGYQQIKNMETKDAAETKKITQSLNKRKSALINSFIKKRKKEFLFIFC
jgi:hypothetical protein